MNVGSVYLDAVLIAGLALVVSVASLILTYRENRRMAATNEQMAATNREMLVENRRMSDANEEMVELTRRMQTASERAAQVAEEEAQRQAQERREANKARFVFRDGTRRGEAYEAHLINRGPHHAENAHATVLWADKVIGSGEEKHRVDRDDDVQIGFRVGRMANALPEDRIVTVRLSYADGNGSHEKEWQIRYSGGTNITSWRSAVLSEPEF